MSYYFKKPFAENGDITQIPTNNQGDGNVSYEEGWPEGYELDPTQNPEDARNLSRTNFNGLFFNITEALQTLQQYGCNPYITASDNDGEPFAYPEGGMCYYTDTTTGEFGVYYSLKSNNTDVPSENGITTRYWQRVFDKDLDTLKSNRITNSPLYYPNGKPSYSISNGNIVFSVKQGSRYLFSNGMNADNSLKSDIVFFTNDAFFTSSLSNLVGDIFVFATNAETVQVLNINNYSSFNTEEQVILEKGTTSLFDVYYFNSEANKWKIRYAGNTAFEDAPNSMCLIAVANIQDDEVISFNVQHTLQLIDINLLNNELKNKQQQLTASSNISLSPTDNNTTFIKAKLPINATPFCLNFGNLDSNGDTDIVSNTTKIIDKGYVSKISTSGSNGSISVSGDSWANTQNAFNYNDNAYCYNYTPGNRWYSFTFTFSSPIEITNLGGYIQYNFSGDYASSGGGYSLIYHNKVTLNFSDGTSADVYYQYLNQSFFGSSPNKITLESTLYGKTITSITISFLHSRSIGYGYIIPFYLSTLQVYLREQEITGASSILTFKVGSNYSKVLSQNADALITSTSGSSMSDIDGMNNIWGTDYTYPLTDWFPGMTSTYTFSSTPAETSNAKLLIKYIDKNANIILQNLSVTFTYFGGITYKALDKISVFETQDLLIDVPDGKYIQKITINIDSTQELSSCEIGAVQLYNNVTGTIASQLAQYPAIYGLSGNGQKYIIATDVPDIEVTHSGYLMLGENGVYLLPGTNVIRKQRNEPTIEDDPALTEGDVWFDLSSEPLGAYVYRNGFWDTFLDVPFGYVTAEYLSPSATATVEGTGITAASVVASTFMTQISATGTYTFNYDGTNWKYDGTNVTLSNYGISVTGTAVSGDKVIVDFDLGTLSVTNIEQYPINQNGYNINAFTENIASLSGRDGRDGQDGKDGKNGAPGAKGDPGIGIPAGGQTSQLLAKASNASYDTKWTTAISTAMFDGGNAGEIIVKNSSDNLDFSWAPMPSGIPDGGQTGECLIKASDSNKDVTWGTIQSLPTGGSPGFVLSKRTGSDYDVIWSDPAGRLAIYDNDTSFMLGCYVYAQQNSYSAVAIENFHNASGIDDTVADGATVISVYYSSMTMAVTNSSNDSIIFWLKPISSANPLHSLVPHWEKTGTVNLSISFDNGTTFSALTDYEPFAMNNQTDFIIKVSMSSGAVVKNIALITK